MSDQDTAPGGAARHEDTLAPWVQTQLGRLLGQPGHARLLQGPTGLGQYGLALALARTGLCESPAASGQACGQCPSCHALDVRTHADLCALMPETLMLALGWPLDEKAQQDIDDKKRKPSKEIRVEAMRDAIEFAQRTSARGRGKVVLVYPAERMNAVTANALLKTLEEPPGDVRFVLASEAAYQLLPTIRSRCQAHTMHWPGEAEALAWLESAGLSSDDAQGLLRAAGGRPDDALELSRQGLSPAHWSALPAAMARGEVASVADWTPARLIDAQQKLCHDLMAQRFGAAPRFFDAKALPQGASPQRLATWAKELSRSARTAEHPFNAGLMLESLVSRAREALHSKA